MDTDVLYWIWLSDALGASNKQTGALLSAIPDALEIYRMDAVALCDRVPKLSRTVVENLSQKSLEHAKRVEAYCLRHGIGILPYSDAFYPDRLKQIFSPPVLLYYKGTIPDMNEKLCLGIVGTRHLSDYGRRMAYRLGYELSLCGAYTVSGMARGIDTAGHIGSLDAQGCTVAVMGCGLDRIYPPENRWLAEKICANGALVSEYPPGELPARHHFPQRNRIISGVSQGICVVEAARGSGSLITASMAQEQGRDIFVLPGNVGNAGFEGSNDLIKAGAVFFTQTTDVLQTYEPLYADTVDLTRLSQADAYAAYDELHVPPIYTPKRGQKNNTPFERTAAEKHETGKRSKTGQHTAVFDTENNGVPSPVVLQDEQQQKIYDALQEPHTVDELAQLCDMESRQVNMQCTMLELSGHITSAPGGLYCRATPEEG